VSEGAARRGGVLAKMGTIIERGPSEVAERAWGGLVTAKVGVETRKRGATMNGEVRDRGPSMQQQKATRAAVHSNISRRLSVSNLAMRGATV
jgi:hypothetical protein